MLSFKDIEAFQKLAPLLVVPAFAAAFANSGALQFIDDPLINWLRTSHFAALVGAGWALWFVTLVTFVGLTLVLVDTFIVWLHVKLSNSLVMPLAGFACITAGLLIFSDLVPSTGLPHINSLWSVGLACYGFTLLERSKL